MSLLAFPILAFEALLLRGKRSGNKGMTHSAQT